MYYNKIFSALSLANSFKSTIFKRILSPAQSARMIDFALEIKSIFSHNPKDEVLVKTLDKLVEYKNKYPNDFDEIFEILKEILNEYEKNPSEVKKNLKELF
ncbi:TPA: hypothetical protein RZJ77_000451 [Campylobacter coli]|nr:hypothetical protein [Campylobacter coli]EAI7225046.1 hypothetical protein [Campylobacter coli]HEB7717465.1 hypothetical protein [Campylobacter coli]HEB8061233.1 hypothetical protein [Campylobacter coli]